MLNNATVPVASGKVIVLSAVGSVTDMVVSKSFALDPSKTIYHSAPVGSLLAPGRHF